jgi:hypothetical protein
MPDESAKKQGFQAGLGLDDGAGLRVVIAQFLDEKKFNWDLFDGYASLRVLTFSASVNAIVKLLDKYTFSNFECIFGYQGVLRDMRDGRLFVGGGKSRGLGKVTAKLTSFTLTYPGHREPLTMLKGLAQLAPGSVESYGLWVQGEGPPGLGDGVEDSEDDWGLGRMVEVPVDPEPLGTWRILARMASARIRHYAEHESLGRLARLGGTTSNGSA